MASGQDKNGPRRGVAEKMARLRAHVHTAMVDAGLSMGQLATELGVGSAQALADYLNGRQELPAWVVLRLTEVTGKPVWWFFDDQPQGITLEAAQVAMQNLSRIRLYLDALESEFQRVIAKHEPAPAESASFEADPPPRRMADVVDLGPYLSRARAILEREVSAEDSGEVSEESVEMIAQGLLSAETGVVATVLVPRNSSESFEKVRRLPVRPPGPLR